MIFRPYIIYENKLSEQISDDNPYKQKLIDMETPSQNHSIYSIFVFGLFGYCWLFFFTLFFYKAHGYLLSAANMIFVSIVIFFTFNKKYLVTNTNKIRVRVLLISSGVVLFSFLTGEFDSGIASSQEIIYSFLSINHKSYIALAIILYFLLGVVLSSYSCPYELYRSFYSAHKAYPSEKNENILINKTLLWAVVYTLGLTLVIYVAFNPAKNEYRNILKNLSIFVIYFWSPVTITALAAKQYIHTFNKAKKIEKEVNNGNY